MFDIGWDEMLFTAIIAIVVIGPKDLPRALRTAGRWIAKVRRVSGHFRAGVENMIREAELQDMEKQWREQNAAIMAQHPVSTTDSGPNPASAEAALIGPDPGLSHGTEGHSNAPTADDAAPEASADTPELPLAAPKAP